MPGLKQAVMLMWSCCPSIWKGDAGWWWCVVRCFAAVEHGLMTLLAWLDRVHLMMLSCCSVMIGINKQQSRGECRAFLSGADGMAKKTFTSLQICARAFSMGFGVMKG
jgi:hypothetical protein